MDRIDEKKFELKRKIFDLSKMEALVFSDPKLTRVYNEMAVNGYAQYGYHYNETIMNIIFNDYVLNSPKYLHKYKKAKPVKKKRRDRTATEKLKQKLTKEDFDDYGSDGDIIDEDSDIVIYDNEDGYDLKIDGEFLFYANPNIKEVLAKVKAFIKENDINLNIWFVPSSGIPKKIDYNGNLISETTTTGSVAGDASYVGYASPFGFSKSGKPKRTPMFRGGVVVGENKKINEDMKDDLIEFMVPEWALTALINGDYSGLEDEDIEKIDAFIKEVSSKYGNANFLMGDYDGGKDEYGFKPSNDIDNLGSNVYGVYIYPDNDINEKCDECEDKKMNEDEEGVTLNNMDEIREYQKTLGRKFGVKREDYKLLRNDALREFAIRMVNKKLQILSWDDLADEGDIDQYLDLESGMDYDSLSKAAEKAISEYGEGKSDGFNIKLKEDAEEIKEHHLSSVEDKKDFINSYYNKHTDEENPLTDDMDDDEIHNLYIDTEKKMGLYEESMIDDKEESMKLKSDSSMMGVDNSSGGSIAEGLEKYSKYLLSADETINRLNKYMELNKINEDRTPSAIVLKNRVGKENEKNFKKDFTDSNTSKTVGSLDNLKNKGDNYEVVEDPYRGGLELEEKSLKPKETDKVDAKRTSKHLTPDEEQEVANYRLGVGDYVYDNEMSEKFKERMIKDMGEDLYKQRLEKIKLRNPKNRPMYGKDVQPVSDKPKEKNRYDVNINENAKITGKYFDEYDKPKFLTVKMKDIKFINEGDIKKYYKKLNTKGFGSSINEGYVEFNAPMNILIENYDFYMNEQNAVFCSYVETNKEFINEMKKYL